MKKVTKNKKDLDQMTIFEIDGVNSALGHGGKRPNAGRKKGREATVVTIVLYVKSVGILV